MPVNPNGGTVSGGGELESSIDTGSNIGGMAGGDAWGGSADSGVTDTRDIGGGLDEAPDRELSDEERDLLEDRAEQMSEYKETASAIMAEQRAAREAKEADMAEVHASGDAYYWGDTTHDGETVQEWILPNGTVLLVNDQGDAVSVTYPPGEGPQYVGDIMYDGEPHSVYEMPGGDQAIIDEDGDYVGLLEDLEPDVIVIDLYLLTDDTDDIGTTVTVQVVPGGEEHGYDTLIVDAETGEVYDTQSTGATDQLGFGLGQTDGTEVVEHYSTYQPPGADYAYVIDADGNVVDTIEVHEDPEWSILGVVEYYEDGTVVVDVGVVEVAVDLVGPEMDVSISIDVLIAEGTAGIEINEDGSWSFETDLDMELGGADIEADLGFGQDAHGNAFLDIETSLKMNVSGIQLEGGQWLHIQQTDDGVEANAGWEGTASALGAYLHHRQEGSIVLDENGVTGTYFDEIGVGIKGLGGIHITSETQMHTDGTLGGTSATTGAFLAAVDKSGNEVLGGGAYLDSEEGAFVSTEHLDDGRDYERVYDEQGLPAAPDGGADSKFSDGSHPEEDAMDNSPSIDVGKSNAGQPRDVFEAVAADDQGVTERTNDLAGRSAEDARGFGDMAGRSDRAGAARPTRTTERDLGLDEDRAPIGASGEPHDRGDVDAVTLPNVGKVIGDGGTVRERLGEFAAARDNNAPAPAPAPADEEKPDKPEETDKPEKPEIATTRDPDAEPRPRYEGDGPVLARPGYDPTAPLPPIIEKRVWDGPGDDDDDLFGNKPGPGPSSGGRPGDGPPVIHLTDDASSMVNSPPPAGDTEDPAAKHGRFPERDRVAVGDPGESGDAVTIPGFGNVVDGPKGTGVGADAAGLLGTTFGGDVSDANPPPPPSDPDSEVFSTSSMGTEVFSTSAAGTELHSMDTGTTDLYSMDAGMTEATGEPGAVGEAGVGEDGLPWKMTAREVAAITPESRTVARRRDRGEAESDVDETAPDTDIPADDITTMTTGETAGDGTDGLEVGRAPTYIERDNKPDLPDTFTVEETEPTEPYVAQGDFVVERLDGQTETDSVAQVETAIPAMSEPVPAEAPEPPPEPMPEPDPIVHEPMAEPEPVNDALDDGLLDDSLDD